MRKMISFEVNGVEQSVEVAPYDLLNKVLREYLGLTGTKRGCDYGGCGSCTVLVDGRPVYSCMVPAMRLEGKSVLTIEGLTKNGVIHPIQDSFMKNGALQCGFSTPGMIMSALGLLNEVKEPNDEQIKQAISGNLCRCTGYVSIIRAISDAAKRINGKSDSPRNSR